MENSERCVSCGKGLLEKGATKFKCPLCSTLIGRCSNCREQGQKYVCPNCGFIGP